VSGPFTASTHGKRGSVALIPPGYPPAPFPKVSPGRSEP
jgi:hypothetical protein